ncbi:Crp/Fnr family transcriptional regulator [Natroniella acetigena]|uniref:Crp/Fnr family transcriptional regulator n=1 Tax=Natroniella acetigena TaxID=52004 RepID=UPI00200AD035|nr:Crp/Fnr family transcriptional regulator [Natroniella acetigena]MCK8828186.1 Crp/Fnr family transcriptional regulator [Natroniella acetigena]
MRIDSLRNYDYFSQLTDKELAEVAKVVRTKEYKKGEIIFFEGEAGNALFMLEKGKIKLVKMKESGEEQILTILKSGSIFAEVIIFDEADYPATAIVLKDSIVGVISKDDMENLIKKIPKLSLELLKIMSKRLRRAQKMVENLGLHNTETRTTNILIYLASEYGSANQEIELELSISQQELANLIGSSRETVSRILNNFKDQGLIDTARQKVIIKDLKGLEKLN